MSSSPLPPPVISAETRHLLRSVLGDSTAADARYVDSVLHALREQRSHPQSPSGDPQRARVSEWMGERMPRLLAVLLALADEAAELRFQLTEATAEREDEPPAHRFEPSRDYRRSYCRREDCGRHVLDPVHDAH